MIKRLIFTFLISGLISQADAQFDTSFIKFNIKRCADSLTDAFKTREWEKFTRYSYPALVGSMGGKKEFAHYISTTFSHIPDTCWKKYETTEVLQVLKTDGDYQAVILLSSILEFENTRYITTSPLIAESWDGGYFWTFFDSQGDLTATKIIKPDLSTAIVLPERKQIQEPIK